MNRQWSNRGERGGWNNRNGQKPYQKRDKWITKPKERKERKSVSVSAPRCFGLPADQPIVQKKERTDMRIFKLAVVEVLGRDYPNYWPTAPTPQSVHRTGHSLSSYSAGHSAAQPVAQMMHQVTPDQTGHRNYQNSRSAGLSDGSATGMHQPHFRHQLNHLPAAAGTGANTTPLPVPYGQSHGLFVTPVTGTPLSGQSRTPGNAITRTPATGTPQPGISGYPTPGWSNDTPVSMSGNLSLWPRPTGSSGWQNSGAIMPGSGTRPVIQRNQLSE